MLQDGIDFYLDVFDKISSIYEDTISSEISISGKLREIFLRLKEKNSEDQVRESLMFVLSVFENYYTDDFNSISDVNLEYLSVEKRSLIIKILKEEMFKYSTEGTI